MKWETGAMIEKVMKGIVVIIMAMMGIHVQVMMKADSLHFPTSISSNQAPSPAPFPCSLPIIYLSSNYIDAESRRNHSRRRNNHSRNRIPGSYFTKTERKCLDDCSKLIKEGLFSGSLLEVVYKMSIRKCLGYTLPWMWVRTKIGCGKIPNPSLSLSLSLISKIKIINQLMIIHSLQ